MGIKAGRLRHRIKIEKKTLAQDPVTGAMNPTWSELETVWAEVAPLSAREFIAAQSAHSKVSARITTRHRSDVDSTMRIVYRNRTYNIEGVLDDPVSGFEYMTLPVSEGLKDGQ